MFQGKPPANSSFLPCERRPVGTIEDSLEDSAHYFLTPRNLGTYYPVGIASEVIWSMLNTFHSRPNQLFSISDVGISHRNIHCTLHSFSFTKAMGQSHTRKRWQYACCAAFIWMR
jgi:hypothetical protein